MKDTVRISFPITLQTAHLRLDKALTLCPEIISRSQATKLISQQKVTLNGKPLLKPSYMTQEGDLLEIEIPNPVTSNLKPYDFPLEILYEDNHLMVINKPAGLVVHPANGHANDTLVNALVYHRKDLSLGFTENRPGLVHRLDKDTSGTLVIAKNDHSQLKLSKQFENKTTHRRYRALIFGIPKSKEGTLTSHLLRHPTDRKRFASVKEGTEAVSQALTH